MDDGVNPCGMCWTGHATGREGHAICPILYPGHQPSSSNRYLTLHWSALHLPQQFSAVGECISPKWDAVFRGKFRV